MHTHHIHTSTHTPYAYTCSASYHIHSKSNAMDASSSFSTSLAKRVSWSCNHSLFAHTAHGPAFFCFSPPYFNLRVRVSFFSALLAILMNLCVCLCVLSVCKRCCRVLSPFCFLFGGLSVSFVIVFTFLFPIRSHSFQSIFAVSSSPNQSYACIIFSTAMRSFSHACACTITFRCGPVPRRAGSDGILMYRMWIHMHIYHTDFVVLPLCSYNCACACQIRQDLVRLILLPIPNPALSMTIVSHIMIAVDIPAAALHVILYSVRVHMAYVIIYIC